MSGPADFDVTGPALNNMMMPTFDGSVFLFFPTKDFFWTFYPSDPPEVCSRESSQGGIFFSRKKKADPRQRNLVTPKVPARGEQSI